MSDRSFQSGGWTQIQRGLPLRGAPPPPRCVGAWAVIGLMGVTLFLATPFPTSAQGLEALVLAQAPFDPPAEGSSVTGSTTPPTETALPDRLPHEKFLLDYLLVAVLFAAALYAVVRPSRRL